MKKVQPSGAQNRKKKEIQRKSRVSTKKGVKYMDKKK